MEESYGEVLARHAGPKPYADDGNVVGVAWATGKHRPSHPEGTRLRNQSFRVPTLFRQGEGNIASCATGKPETDTAESKTWCMCGNSKRENREIPSVPPLRSRGRLVNLTEGTTNLYAGGKSDDFIVPSTRANKAATAVAESVEERRSPKGSVVELPPMFRTLRRIEHHWERHDGHGR